MTTITTALSKTNKGTVEPLLLKRLKAKASNLKVTGVFKSRIEQVAHLEIFLVTCVSNDERSPHYDSDYPIDGSVFELVSGNETKTFDFAKNLQAFLEKHLEDHQARPSASIILNG